MSEPKSPLYGGRWSTRTSISGIPRSTTTHGCGPRPAFHSATATTMRSSAATCRRTIEPTRAGKTCIKPSTSKPSGTRPDPIGETRYASGLAAQYGLPNAIVAQAWLDQSDAAEIIAAQAAFPLVRSVRHKPGGPTAPGESGRTLMADEAWRRGYALLERFGLLFDLQTPWWNLGDAVELARDFPNTTIVLNHTGLPVDRTPAGLQPWREAMARLAEQPKRSSEDLRPRSARPGVDVAATARSCGTSSPCSGPTVACSPATSQSTACAPASRRSSTASARSSVTCRLRRKPNSSARPHGRSIVPNPIIENVSRNEPH